MYRFVCIDDNRELAAHLTCLGFGQVSGWVSRCVMVGVAPTVVLPGVGGAIRALELTVERAAARVAVLAVILAAGRVPSVAGAVGLSRYVAGDALVTVARVGASAARWVVRVMATVGVTG